jgi:UDP-N-acetylmuramyl pentapeptide phosphotransferase/UDP-N-acetylglucosamine-1-phosphate transferase
MISDIVWERLLPAPFIVLAAALFSAGAIVLLAPLLKRYALATPNARSSHLEPTPQGGGIAVVAATLVATIGGAVLAQTQLGNEAVDLITILAGSTLLLAVVGAIDDVRDLPISVRLVLQTVCVAAVFASLSSDVRIFEHLPLWLERLVLVGGGIYFLNVVNFMDGLDWITVAETVPITSGIAIIGIVGSIPWHATILALALLGATLGFAPFNRPVAKIFLGDVGSLPIGLLIGLLLVLLMAEGHIVAGILLPLYYLSDATLTLARRIVRGERFWQAHRTHYYQRATEGGFSVIEIDARIFAANVCLATLAILSAVASSRLVDAASLALGGSIVGWLMCSFAKGKT